MENPNLCIIVSIIISAGILGGITNFLLQYNLEYKRKECRIELFKCIFLSLCASLTIPLFLDLFNSELLKVPENNESIKMLKTIELVEILKNSESFETLDGSKLLKILKNSESIKIPEKVPYPIVNYFIFLGFCVLASFFSKRFLEDLYLRVNKLAAKTNVLEAKTDRLEAKENENNEEPEIEEIEMSSSNSSKSKHRAKNLALEFSNIEIMKVINATLQSKYKFRTISGVAIETELSNDKVEKIFYHLESENLAEKREKKQKPGEFVWKIILPAKPLS